MAWVLLAIPASLSAFIIILVGFPHMRVFVLQDLAKIDDPYRGLGTGLVGRVATWAEVLEIWIEAPFFEDPLHLGRGEYLGPKFFRTLLLGPFFHNHGDLHEN